MSNEFSKEEIRAIQNANSDISTSRNNQNYHKTKTLFFYENNYFLGNHYEPTYGSVKLEQYLNAFSSSIKFNNLPDDVDGFALLKSLFTSGVVKWIKIGNKNFIVHITINKWNYNYTDVIDSIISEPLLKNLNGKKTENFDNVLMRFNTTNTSLIRILHPYITTFDNAYFNLDIASKVSAGKYIFKIAGTTLTTEEIVEMEDALNNLLTDGKPIKVLAKNLGNDMELIPIVLNGDIINSFIQVIKHTKNELLSLMGAPNNNQEAKNERLLSDELDKQDIVESLIFRNFYDHLNITIEKVNKEFNYNITTEIVHNKMNLEKQQEEVEEVEEGNNVLKK